MCTAVAPDAGTGKRAHSMAPDYKRAGRTITALWHPNPLNDLPALVTGKRTSTRGDAMENACRSYGGSPVRHSNKAP